MEKKVAGAPAPAAPTVQMDLENKPATVPIFHTPTTVTKHVFDNSIARVSVTTEELRKKVYRTSKKAKTMEEFVKGKIRILKPKGVTGADMERLWKQFAKEIEKELPGAPAPEAPAEEGEEDEGGKPGG